jgi:hypothetical protein
MLCDLTKTPNSERKLSEDESEKFYFTVKDMLFELSKLAINDIMGVIPAHTTHHFMQIINGILK